PHRNLVANTEQFKAFIPDAMRPGQEVVVTALPLYHIFALMVNFITYFSVGAENWLVANPRDIDAFVDVLKTSRLTVFTGVNTLYGGLTMCPRIKEVDFSHLRAPIGGGLRESGGGDRRRRQGVAEPLAAVESPGRQGLPRRLRPVGTVADPPPQPDDGGRLLGDGGPAVPVDRHQAARRRRQRSRHRRAGRDLRQGSAGDAGLLAETAGQCRRVHRRRLLPHRRHRRVRQAGIPQDR